MHTCGQEKHQRQGAFKVGGILPNSKKHTPAPQIYNYRLNLILLLDPRFVPYPGDNIIHAGLMLPDALMRDSRIDNIQSNMW